MTSAPRTRRWWLLTSSLILILGGLYPVVTEGGTLLAGHPAYPITAGAAIVGGLLGLIIAIRGRQPKKRRWFGTVGAIVGLLGSLVLAAILVYLAPFTAEPDAIALLDDAAAGNIAGVSVDDSATRIELIPEDANGSALVFWPGARIDARAYVPLLLPLVQDGYEVHIVKEPFGMAIFDPNAAAADMGSVDATWSVAGHSLGGVIAAGFAGVSDVGGLVLWASYPASDISGMSATASSLWGPNDGFTTPADVEDSAVNLPASTTFVEIPGANHSVFADIATMPGDGLVGDPEAARAAIIEATRQALADVR